MRRWIYDTKRRKVRQTTNKISLITLHKLFFTGWLVNSDNKLYHKPFQSLRRVCVYGVWRDGARMLTSCCPVAYWLRLTPEAALYTQHDANDLRKSCIVRSFFLSRIVWLLLYSRHILSIQEVIGRMTFAFVGGVISTLRSASVIISNTLTLITNIDYLN